MTLVLRNRTYPMMKGILLAGGAGTRLHPLTQAVSKQLLPVYDKPMIYYPLSTLMLAGIRDILVITGPNEKTLFEKLLGNGKKWGLRLSFETQERPEGIAQAFVIARDFIKQDTVALALGDNIFFGHGLQQRLQQAAALEKGGLIFGCVVKNPSRYGVAVFDKTGKLAAVEEKPKKPKSQYAIAGIYFFDHHAVDVATQLKPSLRGELEIADVIAHYLQQDHLQFVPLGRGIAWLDAGTPESLLQASNFVEAVENRQGLKIGCVEEIAFRMGFVDQEKLAQLGSALKKTEYGQYLQAIAHEELS